MLTGLCETLAPASLGVAGFLTSHFSHVGELTSLKELPCHGDVLETLTHLDPFDTVFCGAAQNAEPPST